MAKALRTRHYMPTCFPLALGLVPSESTKAVAQFIRSRGMACSVYGAQYLLESLYAAGEDEVALDLMTSKATRSLV